MSLVNDTIKVTTIERDEERYNIAVNNINKFDLTDRINIIFGDALNIELEDEYDLIAEEAFNSSLQELKDKYLVDKENK